MAATVALDRSPGLSPDSVQEVSASTSPSKTTQHEVLFEPRAYAKMILHAAKYPHCAVNGLLLAQAQKDSRKSLVLTDCIPLFHQSEGLTPMVEVALGQVEARCERAGLLVAGFYHANRAIRDNAVDVFSQKIADKVAENAVHAPGQGAQQRRTSGSSAVLVTIDNKRLSLVLESPALLVQMVGGGSGESGERDSHVKWRHLAAKSIQVDEDTLALTSIMVQRKIYKDLVDFDNHLDDLTQDYLNVEINMEISDQN